MNVEVANNTLVSLCTKLSSKLGISVSNQALNQRLNESCVGFLKQIFRLKPNIVVYLKSDDDKLEYFKNGTLEKSSLFKRIDIAEIMRRMKYGERYEIKDIYVVTERKMKTRIILYKLTESQLKIRSDKSAKNAKNKGIKKSENTINILGVSLYITNVDENILGIDSFNDFNQYKDSISQLKIELDAQEDDLEEIDFLLKSYQSIDYINDLLDVIEFDSNTKPDLIKFLKQFKSQKSKNKDYIYISFFDSKWQKNIKKYNSFDHYLITPKENLDDKEAVSFIENLKNSIHIPNQFEINRDIEQDEKSTFSKKIYNYFPKITMAEILYEVNRWTDFLEDFRSFHSNKVENQRILVTSLLADGMRVPISSKTIYADYNSHYGNKGGGIYRHVSDQYTPYYVQMLEGRDSNHVLDGLLYHDTSLEIYDHSTDTAGYTEQMFALTYLLGFNFKPRIKNIGQQQLYAFESFEVNDIKFRKINEKIILENYAEIIRLVESIRCSKVKASLILQKINSYNKNNGVTKGLKEIGRILKTKYIIDYYTDGELRKEVQKMLNKGESINSVARLIFFGKHGRLNENTLEKQLEKVSCLNILLSSLIIWNSRYLEKVYNKVKDEPWFDIDEFKRVSPLGTQHVNFLGRYIFENIEISTEDGLRELEIKV